MTTQTVIRPLGLLGLVMLITGAIDSIRNLPATAMFGSTLIFFAVVSSVLFLIPVAVVSAELAKAMPSKGGIYQWVKLATGKQWGFMSIWLQWINTIIWYPTILSFIAGTLAFLINPQLADDKIYLVSVILLSFWGLTFLNLFGVKTSATFAGFCTVIGMIIPMALIIILALVWISSGRPLYVSMSLHSVLPNFKDSQSWISLTAIITSFLGLELATVHIRTVKNAKRTFPQALLISTIIILATMILGALAIAFVIPEKQINLVDGVLVAFRDYFDAFHLAWLMPIIAGMILIGAFGGMVNWIISPAKGLEQAAIDHLLPHFLVKENRYGVAYRILLIQAVLVSLVCTAFLLMPTVNASYWLLTDLSTELYLLMYVLMFISAILLCAKQHFKCYMFWMKNNFGMYLMSVFGLIGCMFAVIVGFIPPGSIDVGGAAHYEVLFSAGIIILLLPAMYWILRKL